MASPINSPSPDNATPHIITKVAPYDPSRGLISEWNEGTVLRVELLDSPEPTAVISGNRLGLQSLARHLLTLSQQGVPAGSHLDFDSYCGWLEDGSAAIRIELD